jgi:hypothetical protein
VIIAEKRLFLPKTLPVFKKGSPFGNRSNSNRRLRRSHRTNAQIKTACPEGQAV